jgi:hypothetical protein
MVELSTAVIRRAAKTEAFKMAVENERGPLDAAGPHSLRL